MKDKIIITKCYHCDNRTGFSVRGRIEQKIHPSEDDFPEVDDLIPPNHPDTYEHPDENSYNDDCDSWNSFWSNYSFLMEEHKKYVESILYYQKSIFLIKCLSCSKPSVLTVGSFIRAGEIQSFIEDDTKTTVDLDSTYGYNVTMIYPDKKLGIKPSTKMPKEVADVFEEARKVYNSSPRASAALLRLALQILLKELGLPGKNINEDIKNLVKHEMISNTQQALDIIRVMGNNSVHPGEINLNEDVTIAENLFDIINFVVEQLISRQDMIKEMYSKIPEKERNNIRQRDNKK